MIEQHIQKLIDCATVAREKSYSPYSHFGVGVPDRQWLGEDR